MTERIGFYTESALCEVLTKQQDCLEEILRSRLSQAALQQLTSQEENVLGCCRHHLCSTKGDAVWLLLPWCVDKMTEAQRRRDCVRLNTPTQGSWL